MALSNKRRVFIEEYLKRWNATEAAKHAGYSPHTARSQGQRLLKRKDIKKQIEKRLEDIGVDKNIIEDRLRNGPIKRKPAFVYLIREEFCGLVKIGISSEPTQRLRHLQTSCPQRLDIVAILQIDNPGTIEAELHVRFSPKHYRGEWFRLTEDDVEGVCEEWESLQQSVESLSSIISVVGMQPRLLD